MPPQTHSPIASSSASLSSSNWPGQPGLEGTSSMGSSPVTGRQKRAAAPQPRHAPGAIELSVAQMHAHSLKAAALDQPDAGEVVSEELADHLVEAPLHGRDGECFGEHRANPTAARLRCDVDAALADARIAGAVT